MTWNSAHVQMNVIMYTVCPHFFLWIFISPGIELEEYRVSNELQIRVKPRDPVPHPKGGGNGYIGEGVDQGEERTCLRVVLLFGLYLLQFYLYTALLTGRVVLWTTGYTGHSVENL